MVCVVLSTAKTFRQPIHNIPVITADHPNRDPTEIKRPKQLNKISKLIHSSNFLSGHNQDRLEFVNAVFANNL